MTFDSDPIERAREMEVYFLEPEKMTRAEALYAIFRIISYRNVEAVTPEHLMHFEVGEVLAEGNPPLEVLINGNGQKFVGYNFPESDHRVLTAREEEAEKVRRTMRYSPI